MSLITWLLLGAVIAEAGVLAILVVATKEARAEAAARAEVEEVLRKAAVADREAAWAARLNAREAEEQLAKVRRVLDRLQAPRGRMGTGKPRNNGTS